MKFKVIDNNTKQEADVERIATSEEWAKNRIRAEFL